MGDSKREAIQAQEQAAVGGSRLPVVPDMPTAEEILPFLREIDGNRWYSNFGPLAMRFEADFARTMAKAQGLAADALHVVTLSSGYHALSIGLRLLGIGQGARVLIPAVTFPACPLAAENVGASALLADIDPQSLTLTPAIARAVAAKVRVDAVMPVCLYGMPLPAQEWDAFAQETGIPVLIDAAAAIETQSYPQRALVAHSLHATKPFGVGEGGLLVTRDAELAGQARMIANFGTVNRIAHCNGENAKMSEYAAAVALAQLARWAGVKARRRAVFEAYREALAPLGPQVEIPEGLGAAIVSHFLVKVNGSDGAQIVEALAARGVGAHRTYLPPLYAHPHFNDLPVANAAGNMLESTDSEAKTHHMRGAAKLEACGVGLPFRTTMTPKDVHETVTILKEILI